MTYVFPHVPKCGGTSLLRHLEASGLNLYVDYDAIVGEPMHRRNREVLQLDFTVFDIIFGHFPVSRYQGDKFRYITLVRDPVDRIVSSYLAQKELFIQKPYTVMPGARWGREIANGMTFVDYVRKVPDMKHVYRHFLHYWPRERFVLVGTTERYPEFLSDLSSLLGVEMKNTVRERKAATTLPLTDSERAEARRLLADEYAWFERFVAVRSTGSAG